MGKFSNIKKQMNSNLVEHTNSAVKELTNISNESKRVANTIHQAKYVLDNIDQQFESQTCLRGTDIDVLFTAIALQVVRQYLLGFITQRTDDKTAANKTLGHTQEHSDRNHKYYNPTLEKIIANPVPFDANMGSKEKGLGVGGGFTHRAKTLGHDPVLGWIFGTANIATSTCTINNLDILKTLKCGSFPPSFELFATYHIITGSDSIGRTKDAFGNHASLLKVLDYTYCHKLLNEGLLGKEKVGASLLKEAVHLSSDVFSTASLPLPIIPSISTSFARTLADYGIDTGNMIKINSQAVFSHAINCLISMVHCLFYNESYDGSLSQYQVRTHKILMYSNFIASTSNVIAISIASGIGIKAQNPQLIKKTLNYLDIGGIMVTIHQIVSSREMIYNIKKEFLTKQWHQIIMEDE